MFVVVQTPEELRVCRWRYSGEGWIFLFEAEIVVLQITSFDTCLFDDPLSWYSFPKHIGFLLWVRITTCIGGEIVVLDLVLIELVAIQQHDVPL